MIHATDILRFWFGQRPMNPGRLDERMDYWFGASSRDALIQKDADIRRRFGPYIELAAVGELDRWADSPKQRLALIILLDQLPRNVYRGKAEAYAQDARAAELALEGIRTAADGTLNPVERIFFYMPLQHAESLELQDESVAATKRLLAEAPTGMEKQFQRVVRFAERHREVVALFGRFPHRNKSLGRKSTPEEIAYLTGNG